MQSESKTTITHALWAIRFKDINSISAFAKSEDEAIAIAEAMGKDAIIKRVRVEELDE